MRKNHSKLSPDLDRVHRVITREFDALGESFEPNELGTILLGGKDENLFRSKLAFRLASKLTRLDMVIAKEWSSDHKRADLALLHRDDVDYPPNREVVVLEFKSMYAFDPLKPDVCDVGNYTAQCGFENNIGRCRREYMHRIKDDLIRWRDSPNGVLAYAVLTATNPLNRIDPELQKVVNETKRNNACLDEHGRGVAKACSQEVESWFSVRPRRRTLHAGRYLGIKTEVISWLIGPYTEDTLPELS